MYKLIFISLIILLFSCHTVKQSTEEVNCNSHVIDKRVHAYDTTASSLSFLVLDSSDNPVQDAIVQISWLESIKEENTVKTSQIKLELKTDNQGQCYTNLFHGITPLTILVTSANKKYEFEFAKSLNGYGYDIYVKICE